MSGGCAAEHAGVFGREAPVRWVVRTGIAKAENADEVVPQFAFQEAGACSRHLARVCSQVIRDAGRGPDVQLAVTARPT